MDGMPRYGWVGMPRDDGVCGAMDVTVRGVIDGVRGAVEQWVEWSVKQFG